jgi:ppGpp synthetase/RelA/SpoT-type nucleotidyltranferase
MALKEAYALRHKYVLQRLASNIEQHLHGLLEREPRIDKVCARPKSVERFIGKSEKKNDDGSLKYDDPLAQIQDQVGARIVTFYKDDVDHVCETVERYLRPVESKALVPESEASFGYIGKHYVMLLPTDVIEKEWDASDIPRFFELQVKTLFQHAWAEANHDLGYKPGVRELSSDELRRLAFTAAQSWGADEIFNEMFRSLK